ncbi:MAG: hypothetical protein JST98_02620 [Bacteroidetes bacterium]|nr:hypothetical protein [Bacteroidota bacterium]
MQPRRLRLRVLLALLPCVLSLFAQQNDIPLNRDIYYDIDRNGAKEGSTMHTGLRPIIQSRAELHNVMGFRPDSGRYYYWITEKLYKEHLIQAKDGGFNLTVDPMFRFETGRELRATANTYADVFALEQNSRGFRLAADLGPTVSFQSMFMESQAVVPVYLYTYAQAQGVVPGQGRLKNFGDRGLDFAWATANVSWSPRPWLNAQLGQGRHFVGNGYRSTMLSDNASPFPYVKFSTITGNKRFQYSAIFAKLQQYGTANRLPTGEAGESLFWWKRATFLHLSANLGPLQLALFEGTMWQTLGDDGVLPFNAMQLNPVIGLNTAANRFQGRNTQLLGLDAKYRLCGKGFLYGQFTLTDPARSRYAWQAGAQWFGLFHKDLHLLAEIDQATPFAYTQRDPRMSWTHDNQPLASPIGTGYTELVVLADYGIKQRFWFQGELSVVAHPYGPRVIEVPGGNIYGPSTPPAAQGWDRQRVFGAVNASWRMNQMTNMQLTIGYSMRDLQPGSTAQDSGYLYVAFHTGLFNRYYDI